MQNVKGKMENGREGAAPSRQGRISCIHFGLRILTFAFCHFPDGPQ
jgi:hypothetical protein